MTTKVNKYITTSGVFLKKESIRIILFVCIFIFCITPLLTLFANIKDVDFSYVLSDNNFYSAIGTTLTYTLISSIISVILSIVISYLLNRSSIKHKKILVLFITFAMLIPTLSIGLGIRVLFGTNGFFQNIFGVDLDLLGMPGLIYGSVIVSFPVTFLLIYDSLQYENKTPYDAAKIMGINDFSTFLRISLPYLKKPIIAAFFACFSLVFSDYGIPMEVAGKLQTLPMYLYQQALSSFQYGRAALVGFVLLIPTVLSFVSDIFFREKKNNSEVSNFAIVKGKIYNYITITIILILILVMALPSISFIALSFIKGYPNNMSFSFDNFASLFSASHGMGLSQYIFNSIIMALLTALFGMILAFVVGYYSTRISGKLGKALHFLAISSIAIPGLVLGIGYIFLFKDTNGFFYGTLAILVVVNVVHFFGQPYLMAKNCLEKINNEYEIIGDTLGISKLQIVFRVILPNAKSTLLEMFSYFFLNSMITISAVAFLCTYKNQPLSILISTFERSSNYEMQAVVSMLILCINVIFKFIFIGVNRLLNLTHIRMEKSEKMSLSRYQFEMLTYIERNGSKIYSQRFLSNELAISIARLNKELSFCINAGYVQENSNGELSISEEGYKALEPYKVKRAIILAAGFGSRMAPVTLDTPKPLVKVNGVRIIDTILDALIEKDIKDIIIVRGYKKEKFDELLEKYPTIKFLDNKDFNITNNISSAVKAVNYFDRCYVFEADLIVSNKNIIRKYEYTTNYLGAKVNETDDWCFYLKGKYINTIQQGGEDCYQFYGISYWTEEDGKKLQNHLLKVYNSRAGKEKFWDMVALKVYKKEYKVEIRKCKKSDLVEIDNFYELVSIDSSYENYPGHNNY